jgi:hypothetical protein
MHSKNFFRLIFPAVALATGLAARADAQACGGPDVSCNGGSKTTPTDSDSFGPTFSEWHSETDPTVPRLVLDKVTLGPGETLVQAEFTITAMASGQLKVEYRDTNPSNVCNGDMFLSVGPFQVAPATPIPGLVLPPLNINQNFPVGPLSSFDGTLDFMGTSGATVNIPPLVQTACVRITDAPTLASFVGPGQIEFIHSTTDSSSFSGCAPITFESDPMAQLQVSVRYVVCGCADCDHDGVCDVDEVDLYGPNSCGPDGIPDDCQVFTDCDHDGIPDQCDEDTTACQCLERNRRMPASLLLYPEFDNRLSNLTLLTVTNTNCDQLQGPVDVELVYINKDNCMEDNFTVRLTPCDTYTVVTSAQNPNFQRGYVYAFAKSVQTGQAITFNYLTGNLMAIGGIEAFDWSVNAVAFKGVTGHRQSTDVDHDGVRDLDGSEYWEAPDRLLVPRFIGQSDTTLFGPFKSELVLINLTGGKQFQTIVDFLIYNDNEEQFSAQKQFYCWDSIYLIDISNAFKESFLDGLASNDPHEIVGRPTNEAGWFLFDGNSAFSPAEFIQGPAVYGRRPALGILLPGQRRPAARGALRRPAARSARRDQRRRPVADPAEPGGVRSRAVTRSSPGSFSHMWAEEVRAEAGWLFPGTLKSVATIPRDGCGSLEWQERPDRSARAEPLARRAARRG